MSDTWLTHEELVKEHRKLKADYERTRETLNLLVEKFARHVHAYQGALSGVVMYSEPPRRLRDLTPTPTPPPTPSPTSERKREPAAPAEGAR